jgi:hypothetical protein
VRFRLSAGTKCHSLNKRSDTNCAAGQRQCHSDLQAKAGCRQVAREMAMEFMPRAISVLDRRSFQGGIRGFLSSAAVPICKQASGSVLIFIDDKFGEGPLRRRGHTRRR